MRKALPKCEMWRIPRVIALVAVLSVVVAGASALVLQLIRHIITIGSLAKGIILM